MATGRWSSIPREHEVRRGATGSRPPWWASGYRSRPGHPARAGPAVRCCVPRRTPSRLAGVAHQDQVLAAAAVVAAVRRRGSDARNLRDAAHEACHALDVGLRGVWKRERIHTALCRKATEPSGYLDRSELVAAELRARAVEALVCRAFNVDYDIRHWATVCLVETVHSYRILLPSAGWVRGGIELHMDSSAAVRMAECITRLH
jgi:hypothetical protein